MKYFERNFETINSLQVVQNNTNWQTTYSSVIQDYMAIWKIPTCIFPKLVTTNKLVKTYLKKQFIFAIKTNFDPK